MNDFLNKIVGNIEDKKEWKALEARASQLPEEYRLVYDEIKHFTWQGGTGLMDPSNLFKQLVNLFEEGAANGKHVLEITGNDIAAFVEKLTSADRTYLDGLKEKLNSTIAKKLGK
jgi:DNA-binding ferritin-like protein (Dps family)